MQGLTQIYLKSAGKNNINFPEAHAVREPVVANLQCALIELFSPAICSGTSFCQRGSNGILTLDAMLVQRRLKASTIFFLMPIKFFNNHGLAPGYMD